MLVLLAALGAASCTRGEEGVERDAPPNVLLITVDTLRADHLGAWGDRLVDTPALDALAEGALVFEDATTAIPITTPSLASLITSRVPREHGALNNTFDLDFAGTTLPEALARRGWRTGAFMPSFLADKAGFRRGFDVYDSPRLGDDLRTADDVVHRAATWMQSVEAEGDGPWFCWLHVLEPHSPYAPGAELEAKYLPPGSGPVDERLRHECLRVERLDYSPEDVEVVRALYRGEVEATDRALAPLLDWVDGHAPGGARAFAGDVLVVFASDHGEMLYEQHDYVGHTAWLYEEMLRVPLLIRFPGGAARGRHAAPANLVDVMPTLLGALGIRPPLGDGIDLLADYAAGERLIVHETFAPEGHYDQQAVRQGSHKYHRPIRDLREDSLRPRGPRLFELSEDRSESNDRAGALPEVVDALEAAFAQWSARRPDPRGVEHPAASPELLEALGALGYTEGAFRETAADDLEGDP